MAQFLAPLINDQQEDANGNPLSGGTISVYLAGTSTPANTTSDKAGLIPNAWPIVLNTLGLNAQGAVWLTGGSAYKFVIKDASNVTLRTIDNISGINDTTVTTDQWVVFQGTPTFVSATSFAVPGDQTQTFAPYTRIKTVNTGGIVHATVVRSVFSTLTTVTVIPDSGSLDSGLSLISTGLVTASNPSIPGSLTQPPFRNRIINGAFRWDVRNVGAVQTINTVLYTMDRFYASRSGSNITAQRVTGSGGYPYAFTLTGAAGNTGIAFGQRIESFNCLDWVNKQINVQVPMSAVGITSVNWTAYTADVTDNWSARTAIGSGVISVSSTVETKYFSFSAGAGAARGVSIEFTAAALGAGQSITWQGAFQAEAGQVSPFEVIDIGEDLRRCQRYYRLIGRDMQGIWVNASIPRFKTGVSPQMRTSPAISLTTSSFSVEDWGQAQYATTTGSLNVINTSSANYVDLNLQGWGSVSVARYAAYLSADVIALSAEL